MSGSPFAVLKFGGTSLATPDARDLAVQRVADARAKNFAVVAVVSAMGRSPDAYSTDGLLRLIGGRSGTRNADVLMASGEMISAAVFAEALVAEGMDAVALTGAQAGIVTDGSHGDAAIVRVDPSAIRELAALGVVPVIAGFQGATDDDVITTLGRGGTDLTAVALGHALGAERVDIYTDVSGAMTADPRRIESARTIERASHQEMSELAQHGAKVMHHKAADYANRSGTPYAIRSLATGDGTIVDDAVEHRRPVTGVAVSRGLTWVRVIRGDLAHQRQRMQAEIEMFRRLAAAAISLDQVAINQAGVAFAVHGERGEEVRSLMGDLNLAIRFREGCGKLSVVGAGMSGTPGVVYEIVTALSSADVEIIHCTDSNITVSSWSRRPTWNAPRPPCTPTSISMQRTRRDDADDDARTCRKRELMHRVRRHDRAAAARAARVVPGDRPVSASAPGGLGPGRTLVDVLGRGHSVVPGRRSASRPAGLHRRGYFRSGGSGSAPDRARGRLRQSRVRNARHPEPAARRVAGAGGDRGRHLLRLGGSGSHPAKKQELERMDGAGVRSRSIPHPRRVSRRPPLVIAGTFALRMDAATSAAKREEPSAFVSDGESPW